MATATIYNLYEQLGLPDFASPVEIADRVAELAGAEHCELAIEILKNPHSKYAFDLILEALNRGDRLMPRLANTEDADAIHDIASKLGLRLKEVVPNTFEVVVKQVESGQLPRLHFSTPVELMVGDRRLLLYALPFRSCRDRFGKKVYLEIDDDESGGLILINDQIVQKLSEEERGTLFQVTLDEMDRRLNSAIFIPSTSVCVPLPDAGRFLFTKTGEEIANSFRIRKSSDRIRDLIRTYYFDVARLLPQFDARIQTETTLKSFSRYAERHFG